MTVTIHTGDCIEIMRGMEAGSVDLVLCDPPYGTTACAWDSVIPFDLMWPALHRVCRPGAAMVFTASQPFTSALVMSNPQEFRYDWTWRKNKGTGHLNAKKRPLRSHEEVLVFCDRTPPYFPQMWMSWPASFARRKTWTPVYGAQTPTTYEGGQRSRYPISVLDFDVVNNDGSGDGRAHPSQKPVALMEYLIRTYSEEGATVLDFCAGSGTTGVAAERCGRRAILCELNPDYAAMARDRIDADAERRRAEAEERARQPDLFQGAAE